jgi:AraC family transcriptional regulator, regulatory protein of adaptative response / DNA-3-methyladenine glycosylase II
MELTSDTCYQALLAHDARFDGLFFVGVRTTGIYCRTVCTAKMPRRENCTFHRSAAAAERAGYRPCLRCRPELAPGNALVDAVSRLAATAAGRIDDGALAEGGVEKLAAELGVSGRHLRRVVEREFGVSPVELAQTSRLLLAKRLLTDTDLSVTDVAFSSGFASLRRFNALFKERYRLNPTALRKARSAPPDAAALTADLAFCPPLDWTALIGFLRGRVSNGTEIVVGERYARTISIGKHEGWIAAAPVPGRDALRVEVAMTLAPVLRQALCAVRRVFDLGAAPNLIAPHLGALAAARPGLRLPGAFDGFEMAVRAVLGQQVSVAAATTLAGRYQRAFGRPIATPLEGLTHLSPTPERVASADPAELVALGIIGARARTIVGLARAIVEGRVSLQPGANVAETMARLKELPGIGEWTAQYVAMRALSWPDAFPHTDLGIKKALGETDPKRILEIAEQWRPWRAYAAMHLWKSLETNPL